MVRVAIFFVFLRDFCPEWTAVDLWSAVAADSPVGERKDSLKRISLAAYTC